MPAMRPDAAVLLLLLAMASVHGQFNQPRPQQQQQPLNNGFNQFNPQQQQQQFNQPQQSNQFNQQQQPQQRFQSGPLIQGPGPVMNPGQQQLGYGNQQGFNGQYMPTGSPPRSSYINTPLRMTNSSFPGARVQLQLSSYTNDDYSLSNGATCTCPPGFPCTFTQPVSSGLTNCTFAFTTILSAKDQTVQYIASEFVPVTGPTITQGNWTQLYTIDMTSKPLAIDIFVHHLGIVVDKTTGNLIYYNYYILVDTFAKGLDDLIPAVTGNPQVISTQMIGQVLGTSLRVSYSVQCMNGMVGPSCDLTCTRSSSSSNVAVCWSNSTGMQSVCQYTDSTFTQVSSCTDCPGGVTNSSCTSSLIQSYSDQGKVSSAYRVWTIVLGCLLALAVIFIIFLIIFYVIVRSREQPPSYRSNDGGFHHSNGASASTRPLLKEHEWRPHHPPAALHRTNQPPEHDTSRASDESSFQQQQRNGGNASVARREAQV